jgi:tetratricopeptide (TPR) repeat protein
MHKCSIAIAVTLLMLPAVGCNKVKARIEMKQGNEYYANEEYKPALAEFQKGLENDPEATFAWRSVGLSALAMFKPGDESPANQDLARVATEAFEHYLADPENAEDQKVKDYLLSMYINGKQFDKALAFVDQERQKDPTKAGDFMRSKINILNLADRYDEAVKLGMDFQGPDAPEILYTLGVSAWDKSYNDPKYSLADREHIVDLGLAATDKALKIKPDYFEAMAYYNLLYREKAKMTTDPVARQAFLDKATEWMQKAIELRKKAAANAPKTPAEG